MSIKQQLQADLTEALKAKDSLKVTTLRSVIGAIQTQEKSGKTAVEFDDNQILELLSKESKKRLDTSEEFHKLGYPERAETESAESAIIQNYLPEAATYDEVVTVASSVFSEYDAPTQRDMGSIIKAVKEHFGASADGKTISDVVRSMIG